MPRQTHCASLMQTKRAASKLCSQHDVEFLTVFFLQTISVESTGQRYYFELNEPFPVCSLIYCFRGILMAAFLHPTAVMDIVKEFVCRAVTNLIVTDR